MFKKILLISNNSAGEIGDTLRTVVDFLRGQKIEVIMDEFCAHIMPDAKVNQMKNGVIDPDFDLAIAIGGDGTMLRAAHLVAEYDIPLLGINRGRLGFLADIPADSVEESLKHILAGNYKEDIRFQLYCEVIRDGKQIMESHAFNDVIIQKGNVARLIELETSVNGDLLHSQRSDGMIISTPTGSTAYALSGGGPILHPALDAMVLVPIAPHTLSNRPIVVDGNSEIKVAVATPEAKTAKLTCDGEITCELRYGDYVLVRKMNITMRLIHPLDSDHYSILRAKLGWG